MALAVTPAFAQDTSADAAAAANENKDATTDGDIVVTARRKDEALQDVPLVVNAVTADTVRNLEIKRFEDIAKVVPGLVIRKDDTGSSAALRGVTFNPFASGNNATVEFYLNDSAVAGQVLFQTLYDIGQIEVLRGPQGTLRGRAAPSGSITVTTRRPDLTEAGVALEASGSSIHKYNGRVAINVPIIQDMLGIRVAGFIDDTDWNRAHSINNPLPPFDRIYGGRVSALFRPTDTLSFNVMYQTAQEQKRSFGAVESGNLADPTLPASPVLINAYDRLALNNDTFVYRAKFTDITWGAEFAFAGQKLNYAGGHHILDNGPYDTASDPGNFFDSTFTQPQLNNYGQQGFHSRQYQTSHEVRLSSDDRLFGALDYVVGLFQQTTSSPTDYVIQTPFFSFPNPAVPGGLDLKTAPVSYINTQIGRRTNTKEQSAFGNLTFHLGESTEISGGLRYIDYKVQSDLLQNTVVTPSAHEDSHFTHTIFSASVKHRFSPELMAYASFGTSWRPGLSVVGDFSLNQSARERGFLILPPETSKSFEVGIKSNLFDKRMIFNITYFHQVYNNYPYRSSSPVFFVNTSLNTRLTPPANQEGVTAFNFVAPVPAKVDGVEAEASFRGENFNIGVSVAYAHGRFTGTVPCNDYFPTDGVPDSVGTQPTVGQIRAATGGDNLAVCTSTLRPNESPEWTGTLSGEYHVPVSTSAQAYIRGFVSYFGKSLNDQKNPIDDIPAYALVDAFAGVRAENGTWDLSLFVKNLTDVKRVLNRGQSVLTTGYATFLGSQTGFTTYRSVNLLESREVGVSLKVAFGSR